MSNMVGTSQTLKLPSPVIAVIRHCLVSDCEVTLAAVSKVRVPLCPPSPVSLSPPGVSTIHHAQMTTACHTSIIHTIGAPLGRSEEMRLYILNGDGPNSAMSPIHHTRTHMTVICHEFS